MYKYFWDTTLAIVEQIKQKHPPAGCASSVTGLREKARPAASADGAAPRAKSKI